MSSVNYLNRKVLIIFGIALVAFTVNVLADQADASKAKSESVKAKVLQQSYPATSPDPDKYPNPDHMVRSGVTASTGPSTSPVYIKPSAKIIVVCRPAPDRIGLAPLPSP